MFTTWLLLCSVVLKYYLMPLRQMLIEPILFMGMLMLRERLWFAQNRVCKSYDLNSRRGVVTVQRAVQTLSKSYKWVIVTKSDQIKI